MGKIIKSTLPPIGMRIMKSAIAIAVCYLVSFVRGNSGIVFYSQLAALWCIQMYVSNSRKNAVQRIIGTVIGAVYGLIFLLIEEKTTISAGKGEAVNALVISGMIIVVLYTTVLIKKKQASYFSCVVFLSIVVNHAADSNPYLFVWNRFLDTVIGIIVGIGVNTFSLPKEKRKDILFISGLDDTLLGKNDGLSDYSKVELNRMLDEGANFTISTMRTPASLRETMEGIRLRLPVIAMDGAVLYDLLENVYVKTYVISNGMSKEILKLVHEQGLECFVNVIIDDMLVIFYRETQDPVHAALVGQMRRSPWRNYVKSEALHEEEVVYFMLIYPREIIESFYQVLAENGMTDKLKVLKYDSVDYPGYAYIKIYNKNATRDHMCQYLKKMLGFEKTVTFGSVEGCYDVVVRPGDTNKVVHELKKRYEPVKRL
ncbi:MAG: HAD hydrolase family protein [Eubacteriales bacterium]|nr:HAD hydrolase family protein [Eubacteriales bacterium]